MEGELTVSGVSSQCIIFQPLACICGGSLNKDSCGSFAHLNVIFDANRFKCETDLNYIYIYIFELQPSPEGELTR